ncbi:MAG: zinc ABC transporter substrate-binding protein [Phycisphaeraceae bacterium]|nr:zinc ABC transporter substrate-binding protein [Phycisphaeraceae bacterium]
MLARVCFVLGLGLLLIACGQAPQSPAAEHSPSSVRPTSYPYRIVTTIAMITDIVQQVAGAHATVTGVIGSGVDPHLFRPTRSDVAAMLGADVVFYSGLHLEGKMGDTLVQVARRKPVFAVTERIDESYLLPLPGSDGLHDPHVWMDVAAWSKAVEVVADALTQFDPDHAADYAANAAAYQQELAALDAYVKQITVGIPPAARVLVTAHDAFGYFGRAYGLEVRGIQGISTESEAGLEDLNRLVDLVATRRINAVFVETSVAQKNVRALVEGAAARGHALLIGGTLFSDAMGAPGTYEGTYIGMIDHNATTIARALGGDAPPRGMHGKLASPLEHQP